MAAHPFPAWIRLLQGATAGVALLAGASLAASPLPPPERGSVPIEVVPFAGTAALPGPWASALAPWPACRGCDLRGADLRGRHLIGLDLRGADLSGADLRGAN
ncbi:MAG: pentapeptide repeat-containing protein, partial [Prochlorococcaceae cyanobacterium]